MCSEHGDAHIDTQPTIHSFVIYIIFTTMQLLRNRLVATARRCMKNNASLGQVYGSMQQAYQQMQTPLTYQEPSARV